MASRKVGPRSITYTCSDTNNLMKRRHAIPVCCSRDQVPLLQNNWAINIPLHKNAAYPLSTISTELHYMYTYTASECFFERPKPTPSEFSTAKTMAHFCHRLTVSCVFATSKHQIVLATKMRQLAAH